MENQMTETKENTKIMAQIDADWGAPEISGNDIAIPMVLINQYMSDKVKDGDAKFGELRDTSENKLLGGNGEKFEFIPFYMEKKWAEYSVTGDDKKYLQSVPITAANENLPIEEDGIVRDRVYYFYVLPANNVEHGIPYVIPLRRTSAIAAKHIATQMYVKNRQAGKSPAAYIICLDTKKETGKKGDYAVATFSVGRETTPEEQSVCLKWLKSVKAGTAKANEEDLDHTEGSEKEVGQPNNDGGEQKEF